MSIYNNVFVFAENNISETLAMMKPEELEFCKLMKNAIIPFESIYRTQNHKHTNTVVAMFKKLRRLIGIDHEYYVGITNYLVNIMSYGSLFNLKTLLKIRISDYISGITKELLGMLFDRYQIWYNDDVIDFLFDESSNVSCTDGSINETHNNYYDDNFTNADFSVLEKEGRTGGINMYYSSCDGVPSVTKYCVGGMYSKQLEQVVAALRVCVEHLREYPETFDKYMVSSMELLIKYFETGDEDYFKKHCVEWINTKSRIHYTMGFIEVYHDPKGMIGEAGAEITFCPYDFSKLNPVLLKLESRLPIKSEYQRKTHGTTLNVSINRKIFGAGAYGQLYQTAAYCLPNYNDIRSAHGSKQVIYSVNKPTIVGREIIDIFTPASKKEFDRKYRNERNISLDMWDLQVLLHETVGHASGQYADGVNDTIYDANITKDKSSLEELRAEINALYMSVVETEILEENDMYKGWLSVLGKEELQKQCILNMVHATLRRFFSQKPDFTIVEGAHARANTVIANWLMKNNCIEMVQEEIEYNSEKYVLYSFNVVDLEKSIVKITELVSLIQEIKSTANSKMCCELFDEYTTGPITVNDANKIRVEICKANKITQNNVDTNAMLFPKLDGSSDVYSDIFEQDMVYC